MKEFLQKVDRLCFEYGYCIDSIDNAIEIGDENESIKVLYLDGDGLNFENYN